MQIRENVAKKRLRDGLTVFGSSVRLPEPGLCEILGAAGFDFVILDGEHGAIDASAIDRLVQGCFAGGTVPVARVLRNGDWPAVMHALDLGAQGVLLPHCRTARDAAAFRDAALYPPEGHRGFGPGRSMHWGRTSTEEYLSGINEAVLLIALIEDPDAVDNVGEIAACGLDCLWVGTGDLALSFGVPGQRRHPKVLDASRKILDACLAHNVAAGFPAGDVEEAEWAKAQGFRVIGYGGAESYVMQAARGFLGPLSR
jgi:4-hydroxy-2-oxoheptanedioate aldolase